MYDKDSGITFFYLKSQLPLVTKICKKKKLYQNLLSYKCTCVFTWFYIVWFASENYYSRFFVTPTNLSATISVAAGIQAVFVCLFFFGEIAAKRKHLGYRTTRYRRHRNGGREIGRPNKKFHSNNFLVCITQCKIGHKHACMMRGSGPLLVFYKSQRPERAEIWGKQNCARILLWWCIKPMLFWFYLPVRCCLFL